MTNVKLVGLAGGSCSGKTTFVKWLVRELAHVGCAVISQDNYYRVQRDDGRDPAATNFDHPDSIDFELLVRHLRRLSAGQAITMPVYDFHTHERTDQTIAVEPAPLVFIEGILILTNTELVSTLDASVFVDCDSATRFDRRMQRDQRQRGRSKESIVAQFEGQVRPMHDQFVEPSKQLADLVLSQRQYQDEVGGGKPRARALCEQLLESD